MWVYNYKFFFYNYNFNNYSVGKQHIPTDWKYTFFSSFERVLCCCTRNVVGLCCLCCCKFRLLDYAFFEVLGEVHAGLLRRMIGSDLLHI